VEEGFSAIGVLPCTKAVPSFHFHSALEGNGVAERRWLSGNIRKDETVP